MPDYVLEIAENARHIRASRGFVIIEEKATELGRIPIDSILTVILSADGLTLTKDFLARMAAENIPVIICGKDYMPTSIASPLSAHYRSLGVLRKQIEASSVLYKQLWKAVVESKISNQAQTMLACRPEADETAARLRDKARRVKSGDSENQEGQSARLYWPALFGKDFFRNPDGGGLNTALNYGYAVLRAAVARAVCGAGLLPMLGIHHANSYNAFCLADDLMEPLRPLVDRLIFELSDKRETLELTPENKRIICRLLRRKVFIGGESLALTSTAASIAQSLTRSLNEGRMDLKLPQLLDPPSLEQVELL